MPSKTKFYVTLTGGVLIILAVFFFGINFPLKNIKKINASIIEQRQVLGSLNNQESYQKELKSEGEKMESLKRPVDDLIIDKSKILDLIIELENIAKKTNNKHTISLLEQKEAKKSNESEKEKKEEKEKSGDKVLFQVSCEASFPDLMKFLAYVENMKYHAEITSLNIQYKNSQETSANFGLSFVLKVDVKQ